MGVVYDEGLLRREKSRVGNLRISKNRSAAHIRKLPICNLCSVIPILLTALQNKSEVFYHFQLFTAALQTQLKCIVRTIRSDNGGEYVGKEFEERFAQKGNKPGLHKTSIIFFSNISLKKQESDTNSLPHKHHNKMVSHPNNSGSCPQHVSLTQPANELWAEAVAYATYIQNIVLSSKRKATPFETLHGKKPNESHLRIFGSIAFIHFSDAERLKPTPKL